MLAAITLFTVLTISVMIIRVASVALRLTGLPEETARFQARSAFTGAGFTTSESESAVNHPLRRRIISLLMVTGNLGLVSVLATLVVSFVNAAEEGGGIVNQALWLAGVVIVLWAVALNPRADRILCGAIGRLLKRNPALGAHRPLNLLQLPSGYAVYQLSAKACQASKSGDLMEAGWRVLGVRRADGAYLTDPVGRAALGEGDEVYVYGLESALGTQDLTSIDNEGGTMGRTAQ